MSPIGAPDVAWSSDNCGAVDSGVVKTHGALKPLPVLEVAASGNFGLRFNVKLTDAHQG
jgi:hypothetical protein